MTHPLDALLAGMASPDPAVRDGWAYQELAEGIESGRLAAHHHTIRSTALANLRSTEVQARTFAPLILAWLLEAGDRDRNAFDAVARWYPQEQDTRGYDSELGWLHAVAHGADYLGAAARVGLAQPADVLDVLAARLLAPGEAWVDQEPARAAHAALEALRRCSADPSVCRAETSWLDTIDQALTAWEASAPEGRPPMWLGNVYATVTTLHVAIACNDHVDHTDHAGLSVVTAVQAKLAAVAQRMTPWLFTRQEPQPAP